MDTVTDDHVLSYLVTSDLDDRMKVWIVTSMYTNWIEGRENPRQPKGTETWLVTVFGRHTEPFIEVAKRYGVTVEEIVHDAEEERYDLVAGGPGTGWGSASDPPKPLEKAT